MRVNGVEKLTCITPLHTVARNGGRIRVEPLRNFPVISDLVVDMGGLYTRMEEVGHLPLNLDSLEAAHKKERPAGPAGDGYQRLADCIECGLCISACPISGSSSGYLGPAVLAGCQQHGIRGEDHLLRLADSENGVWRCHSAFECTAVCPSYVDPGWRIMDLRRKVFRERLAQHFRPGRKQVPMQMEVKDG